MKTIGYENIEDILLSITDPNTGGAISSVPGVSAPKINGATSIYNVEAEGGEGVAGWNTDITWSAGTGSISWSSGNLNLPNGTQVPISSGSTSVSTYTYIYVDTTTGTVNTTTSALNAVGENKIMLCVAFPNSGKHVTYKAFGSPYQNSLTTGSDIASGTITTGLIQAGAITTNLIATDAVTANEIASNSIAATHIQSGAVTASKINVNTLSAITANMGDVHVGVTTSGSSNQSGIRLYPDSDGGIMQFYYNKSVVGTIKGMIINGSSSGIGIVGTPYVGLGGTTFCTGKLRIPVGTDLYN